MSSETKTQNKESGNHHDHLATFWLQLLVIDVAPHFIVFCMLITSPVVEIKMVKSSVAPVIKLCLQHDKCLTFSLSSTKIRQRSVLFLCDEKCISTLFTA